MKVDVITSNYIGAKEKLYKNFATILKISSIAGVSAIKVSNGEFFVSKPLWVFQIFLTVVNFVHFYFCPGYIHSLEKETPNNFQPTNSTFYVPRGAEDSAVKLANIMLQSGPTLIMRIANSILLPKHLPKIFRRLAYLQKMLSRDLDSNTIHDPKIWIFIMLIGLMSVPLQAYTFIIANFEVSTKNWRYRIMIGFGMFNIFGMVCTEVQYIYLCCIIRNRFKVINKKISSSRRDQTFHLPGQNVVNVHNILKLRSHCYSLHQSCKELNLLYSIQLFLTLFSTGILCLLALYFGIFGGYSYVHQVENDYTKKFSRYIRAYAWTAYYSSRFFVICFATDYLITEVSKTRNVIFELLHECRDSQMQKELWILYNFLACNKCQFTACGLFRIGLPLITSAVTAGTTYIVILVQMHQQQTEHEINLC